MKIKYWKVIAELTHIINPKIYIIKQECKSNEKATKLLCEIHDALQAARAKFVEYLDKD